MNESDLPPPNDRDDAPARGTLEKIAFPALIAGVAVLFIVLLCLTWLKWGDPIIDTGRELEIPWKVSMGKVLYRDMAYNYGPFSPYWNALFLKLFGVQVTSMMLSGLLCAVSGMVLVFLTARIFLNRIAAILLVAIFLFECVFQHYYPNGNFNFILPYSFPAVHGILFALAAFLCLSRYLGGGGRKPLVLAGSFVGLCLLCKIEIAGAILVPLALMPFLMRLKAGEGWKAARQDTLAWATPLAILVAVGLLPFIAAASFQQVVWQNVFKPQLVDFSANVFFMEHLGVAGLKMNLIMIVKSLGLWAILVVAAGWAGSLLAKDKGTDQKALSLGLGLLLGALALGAAWLIQVQGADQSWRFELANLGYRCLPVVGLIILGASLLTSIPGGGAIRARDARLTAFSLFALLCLLRIFFTAGTFHYGFCLALPALILFVIFLVDILPAWFPWQARNPRFYSAAVLCFVLLFAARNFACLSMVFYPEKNVELTGPGGTLKALPFPFGMDLKTAMAHFEEKSEPGETLVVLPEGAAINFLTLQPNPTYYNLFIPPELNGPGVEAEVIAQLEAEKVDRIMVVDRPVVEYGCRGLGIDYGLDLMNYIKEHYEEEAAFGPPPYGTVPGGCVIYRIRGKKEEKKEGQAPF